jgi:hypothetical protein
MILKMSGRRGVRDRMTAMIMRREGKSDWDLAPARIDGSDFDGSIILLQLSGMSAKISVFTDDEIPG